MAINERLHAVFGRRSSPKMPSSPRKHVVPDTIRNGIIAIMGEFCGTFMFLFLSFLGADTAIKNNNPIDPNAPLSPFSVFFIACSFGTALAVNVWIFYRVTGGMFNPAVSGMTALRVCALLKYPQVTFGLLLAGVVKPMRAATVLIAQLAAAISAAAVVKGIVPDSVSVANSLANGTSKAQGVFLEMFLTAQLVLTVFFLAVEKHRATFLAPIGIGTSVFIAHLTGTSYTGTGINPARSFGPACIDGFVGHHWIYWVGPLMGSLLSFAVYSTFKWLNYYNANPGQDSDDTERGVHSPTSNSQAQELKNVRSMSEASDGTLQATGLKESH